jgi:hypothetical protein
MTPGGPLNWIIAFAMLAVALIGGLARRITLRDGSVIDGETNPRAFWMFIGGCAIGGFTLLVQAALSFR